MYFQIFSISNQNHDTLNNICVNGHALAPKSKQTEDKDNSKILGLTFSMFTLCNPVYCF